MKTTHITSKEMENIFYTINAQHQICKVKMKRIFFNLWKIFHKISSLLFNAQCWLIEYPSWLDAVGRSDWTQSINDKAIPKRLFMDRDVEISQDFRKVQSFWIWKFTKNFNGLFLAHKSLFGNSELSLLIFIIVNIILPFILQPILFFLLPTLLHRFPLSSLRDHFKNITWHIH